MKKLGIVLFFVFACSSLFGNEEASVHAEHVPSVADLAAPYFNFIVLWSFLIFKIRKPIANYFENKSRSVETRYLAAKDKLKDITDKINLYKVKLESVEAETKSIVQNAGEESETFSRNLKLETMERVEKLKKDSHLKMESEKKHAIKKINEELVNLVINTSKQEIVSKEEYKAKVSNKLIKAI